MVQPSRFDNDILIDFLLFMFLFMFMLLLNMTQQDDADDDKEEEEDKGNVKNVAPMTNNRILRGLLVVLFELLYIYICIWV